VNVYFVRTGWRGAPTASPTGWRSKLATKLHSDYDQANWLTQQIDSTLNQEVFNSFTPIGLESSREIDQISGPSSFNLKQKTSWTYFANGKMSGLTTVAPSQTHCSMPCTNTQSIESHTVSYLDTNPNFPSNRCRRRRQAARPSSIGTTTWAASSA